VDETAYRAWLDGEPIQPVTAMQQPGRVRRVEAAFGDLEAHFARDGMREVMARMAYGRADVEAGRAVPKGLVFAGDPVIGMQTLRAAAKKYQDYLAARPQPPRLDGSRFHPLRPPLPAPGRTLPPTGFWIFQANPGRWDIDRWLGTGEASLLYLVSRDDLAHVHVGDLGVLRRNVGKGRRGAVVAFVEVVEAPRMRAEPDARFFRDPADAGPAQRVMLEVLLAPDAQIATDDLPATAAYANLRTGLQRTTTPLAEAAFRELAAMAGLSPLDVMVTRGARSLGGIRELEAMADLDPKRREVVSSRIERGPIGEAVKARRGHRCQVCEGLGLPAVAFVKRDGTPYAEAHHVVAVAQLVRGSLAAANIMVLCPNHHRQAHLGAFELHADGADHWVVEVDGRRLRLEKTTL